MISAEGDGYTNGTVSNSDSLSLSSSVSKAMHGLLSPAHEHTQAHWAPVPTVPSSSSGEGTAAEAMNKGPVPGPSPPLGVPFVVVGSATAQCSESVKGLPPAHLSARLGLGLPSGGLTIGLWANFPVEGAGNSYSYSNSSDSSSSSSGSGLQRGPSRHGSESRSSSDCDGTLVSLLSLRAVDSRSDAHVASSRIHKIESAPAQNSGLCFVDLR
jgi:hypothetical protein